MQVKFFRFQILRFYHKLQDSVLFKIQTNLVFWHSKLFSKVCLTGLYFDFDILNCSQRFVWLVCILSFVLAFGHSKMIWMIYEISNKHLEIICFNAIYFILQVFHKIITTGHQRLQPLFDCLLTIIVNGKKN